jgi:Holliday junction resolvase RusA-like endonuclease
MTAPITLIIDGVYTPAATRAYENMVRQLAALEMRGKAPLQGAVRIELLIELGVPTSWSERKRAAAISGDIWPAGKPDLDNLAKAGLDACSGILIADDAQIVELRAVKKYGEPKLVLTVWPLQSGVLR